MTHLISITEEDPRWNACGGPEERGQGFNKHNQKDRTVGELSPSILQPKKRRQAARDGVLDFGGVAYGGVGL
jgi:hypothetical protein